MNKIHIIITAVCTIIIIATAFLGYTFYKEIQIVEQDHATVANIVQLINQNQQQAPK